MHHITQLLKTHRGVEQWQLVGLITQRSWVRIPPPLPVTGSSSPDEPVLCLSSDT